MDILFGINGEGLGHAMRSAEMIRLLKKDFSVKTVAGGNAFDYLKDDAHEIFYLRFVTRNGRIMNVRTFFYNLFRAHLFLFSFISLFVSCIRDRPKVIVCDFEPLSAYVGLLLRIPVISFDNQHVVTDTKVSGVDNFFKTMLYKLIVYFMCPFPRHKIITGFFFPKKLADNVTLVPPVIRKEVLKKKTFKGKEVLIYFSLENDSVLDIVEELKVRCLFYGKTKKKSSKFIKKRDFSVKGFASDLANCRAVVSGAGMTTLGEAFYLKKPVLCFPLNGHIEQEVNAYYVEKRGFGESLPFRDKKKMKKFFGNLGKYDRNLKRFDFTNKDSYSALKKVIEGFI